MNASRNGSLRVEYFPIFGTSNTQSSSDKFRLLQNLRQLLLVPICAACLNSAIFLLRAYFTREIKFPFDITRYAPLLLTMKLPKTRQKSIFGTIHFF